MATIRTIRTVRPAYTESEAFAVAEALNTQAVAIRTRMLETEHRAKNHRLNGRDTASDIVLQELPLLTARLNAVNAARIALADAMNV